MESIVRSSTAMGAALRRQRKKLKLSQSDLGRRINLRQATLSALEAGTGDAKLSTLLDTMAALGLEIVVRPRSTISDSDFEAAF